MNAKSPLSIVRDGFVNFVSGLGNVLQAKAPNSTYVLSAYTQQELDAAYRETWFRKIVDLPPFDAVREWRKWQADDEAIELIEAEEKRLGLSQKLRKAMTWGRLYGGGALVMGIPGQNPSAPLVIEAVEEGGLKYIHATHRFALTAREIDRDPQSAGYGGPVMYQFALKDGGMLDVHPSRVIRFLGNEVPDFGAGAAEAWSDSLWQACRKSVLDLDTATSASVELLHEARVDVIKIPDLMENLATIGFENRLKERFGAAQSLKSMINALILDSAEEYERKTAEFSGLPDLLKILMMFVSGASDVPATRMFGKAPDGMNATGESDLRNYYDMVRARQKNDVTPALDPLDQVMLRSAGVATGAPADEGLKAEGKSEADKIFYEWNPLWQMPPEIKAATDKAIADTAKVIADTGLVPEAALAKGFQNRLVEDGVYPGLQEALDEAEEAGELAPIQVAPTPEELAIEAQARAGIAPGVPTPPANTNVKAKKTADRLVMDGRVVATLQTMIKDASPRTLYVRRDVLNSADIVKWAKAQGFETVVPDLHITLAHSKQPVDWMKVGAPWDQGEDGKVTLPPGGPRIVEPLGTKGAVVLFVTSSALSWRHESIKNAGASWDYEEYQPHVTITYKSNLSEAELQRVVPYRGKIELGPEIFEELIEGALVDLVEG